jgi:glycosyltransferase involved in cell wall biosynthesis
VIVPAEGPAVTSETFEVAVVIPVRNGASVISRQLQALCDQAGAPPFEVIVADNGSNDALRSVVQRFEHRVALRVVDASHRRGAAHARNVGASVAGGAEALLFCDADDVVGANWVQSLVAGLRSAPLVTGPVLYADHPLTTREIAARAVPDSPRRYFGQVQFAGSNNLAISAEVFESLGGFDEDLKRGEDADLSIRAQYFGHRLGWSPGALIVTLRRPGALAAMSQFFWYGFYDPALYKKLKGRGLRPRRISEQVRPYLALIYRLPRLLGSRRVSWLTNASQHLGRIVGSIHFRVWCP